MAEGNLSENISLIPMEHIERAILFIRGEKFMLDIDLATIYGVETKVLNQAVKRNVTRFPSDFMFQLSETEKSEVVTNCDHLARLKFWPYLPYAFTEHGALMMANVLNSERAAQTSVQVVRVFVRLRQMQSPNAELARKLEALEKKYDAQFKVVFDAIRQLMSPPAKAVSLAAYLHGYFRSTMSLALEIGSHRNKRNTLPSSASVAPRLTQADLI